MNPIALASLQTALNQIAANIATVSASPQPTYSENGRNVSKTEYLSMLIEKQEALMKAIQFQSGPFEIRA